MKQRLKKALLFVLLISFPLYGEIREASHFNALFEVVDTESLILLDIDDTLLIPKQTLGSDVWFQYRAQHYRKQGLETRKAFEKALAEWEAVRHLSQMQLVEQSSGDIVKELQQKGMTVMGLTTQGLALGTRTVQQLQEVGIDLSLTAPSKEDCYFINRHGVLYRKGILFTSGTPKGKALLKWLDEIGYHPKKIVFINDKETHLLDVAGEVEQRGIAFIGLRYSYSDERVSRFDPQIADVQFFQSSFAHILSDEEARAVLRSKQAS